MSSPLQNRVVIILLGAILAALGILIGVLVSGRGASAPPPSVPTLAQGTGPGGAAGETSAAAAPTAPTYELFVDKDEHFVRAGSAEGLRVGGTVDIQGEGGAQVGTGTVLEVWDHLARVSLDQGAAGAEPPLRASVKAPSRPAGEASGGGGLRGSATLAGIGPAKRLTLYNSGSQGWTGCELRLPTNKRYWLASLRAGDQERIMVAKFNQDGVPRDLPLSWVSVSCQQGSARFPIY